MKRKNLVLGITGSVAIYKACEIIRALHTQGICIDVILTEHARQLISARLFVSLLSPVNQDDVPGGVYWDKDNNEFAF